MNVRVPQPTRLSTAIEYYYTKAELSCNDIRKLFGNVSRSKMTKLRKLALEEMARRDTRIWDDAKVNTEVAYEAWGIDIERLEGNYKHLKHIGMEAVV